MKIGKSNEIELKCDDHEIVRAINATCTWHAVLYDFVAAFEAKHFEHSHFQEIAKRVRVFSIPSFDREPLRFCVRLCTPIKSKDIYIANVVPKRRRIETKT